MARTTKRNAVRADIPSPAQIITDAIIARLEAGTRPWKKSWAGIAPSRPLRACGTPYKGGNIFWLWLVADMMGFASPYWMTYRQSSELGGQVRRGEKSTIAIFYKSYGKTTTDATGVERDEKRMVLRSYPVFNCSQIDGLPERYYPAPLTKPNGDSNEAHVAEVMKFFEAVPADTRHGGDAAYYSRATDHIQLPPVDAFIDFNTYSATRTHELAHWSGNAKRLDREFGKRFGDDAYAVEELTAELTSAIIGSELALPVDHLDDHASYLAHWLRVLKADNRAILTVASKADQAATYLMTLAGRRPDPADEQEEEIESIANDYTVMTVANAA